MTYYLFIPEAAPSLNRYAYSHWRVRHADKQRWAKMIAAAALRAKATKAVGPRRVLFQRWGKRRLDHDNFVGGLKGPIDCLKKLGLIVDDDEQHATFLFEQHSGKGADPHTVIGLEDL